jgi:hypothetical protein
MYIAALRIADDFGCDTIGIQYQQGLKDLAPASDLAEGLLNNVDRPPVRARGNGRVLYEPTRCRTSTKWTSARGWTRWRPIASGRRWDTIRRRRCTTCAMASRTRERRRGIRVGLRDLGRRAAGAFHRRLRGRGQRAPAAHVLPVGRRQPQGRQQAGRDRMEPRVRGWRR